MLIDAKDLAARLDEPGLLLVDVRPPERWRAGTIPGAVSLDVYGYFIPSSRPGDEAGGIVDLDAAAWAGLRAAGADRARTTVYFEEDTGMIAPRGLWFHDYAELPGGLILDGGVSAWRAAGGAVVPGVGAPTAIAVAAARRGPTDRGLLATVADVRHRDPARTQLLDVRRRSEHEGSFVHPCCARAGRIPGSLFLFWEDVLADGKYRPAAEIAARAAAAGLDPGCDIITYCHRGARAATVLYALRRAGFARVRVFVGSWHEWADRTDLPVEAG